MKKVYFKYFTPAFSGFLDKLKNDLADTVGLYDMQYYKDEDLYSSLYAVLMRSGFEEVQRFLYINQFCI